MRSWRTRPGSQAGPAAPVLHIPPSRPSPGPPSMSDPGQVMASLWGSVSPMGISVEAGTCGCMLPSILTLQDPGIPVQPAGGSGLCSRGGCAPRPWRSDLRQTWTGLGVNHPTCGAGAPRASLKHRAWRVRDLAVPSQLFFLFLRLCKPMKMQC